MTMDQEVLAALQAHSAAGSGVALGALDGRAAGRAHQPQLQDHHAERSAMCMRIPGEKTGDYINRAVEADNAKAAAAAGVNAEVLFFDAARRADALPLPRGLPHHVAGAVPDPARRPGARRPGAAPDAPLGPELRLPLRALQHDRRLSEAAGQAGRRAARGLSRRGRRGGQGARGPRQPSRGARALPLRSFVGEFPR